MIDKITRFVSSADAPSASRHNELVFRAEDLDRHFDHEHEDGIHAAPRFEKGIATLTRYPSETSWTVNVAEGVSISFEGSYPYFTKIVVTRDEPKPSHLWAVIALGNGSIPIPEVTPERTDSTAKIFTGNDNNFLRIDLIVIGL